MQILIFKSAKMPLFRHEGKKIQLATSRTRSRSRSCTQHGATYVLELTSSERSTATHVVSRPRSCCSRRVRNASAELCSSRSADKASLSFFDQSADFQAFHLNESSLDFLLEVCHRHHHTSPDGLSGREIRRYIWCGRCDEL